MPGLFIGGRGGENRYRVPRIHDVHRGGVRCHKVWRPASRDYLKPRSRGSADALELAKGECPLWVRSGHSSLVRSMSAFDPKRTFTRFRSIAGILAYDLEGRCEGHLRTTSMDVSALIVGLEKLLDRSLGPKSWTTSPIYLHCKHITYRRWRPSRRPYLPGLIFAATNGEPKADSICCQNKHRHSPTSSPRRISSP